jgi:hypothetical protein
MQCVTFEPQLYRWRLLLLRRCLHLNSLSFTVAVVAPEARSIEPGMFSSHFLFYNPPVPHQL